jgi:serine/threonine protein kinase
LFGAIEKFPSTTQIFPDWPVIDSLSAMDEARPSTIGDYLVLYDLGYGVTGKVKLGQHIATQRQVAIKIIKKSQFDKNPELRGKVHREIALMRLLDHPHLLKLVEVCESPNHLYIILEHAPHGELFEALVANRSLSTELGMKLFRQIIYGLDFLHSHGICHRDLKPENILLDEYDDVKIGDFGFARWMRANIADTACGSPHYAAPEVVRGIPYDGRCADIWSSGVILFALLAGRLPFNDPAIRNLLAKVKACQYTMPSDLPAEIQSLISGMLTVDTNARLTIRQIKEHPAFRIGISIQTYVLPCPLPMPRIPDPIDPSVIDGQTLETLRQIGFADDEELFAEFTSEGTKMAKVFYYMLTSTTSLNNLPWHTDITGETPSPLSDDFLVSPPSVAFGSAEVNPFGRRRRIEEVSSAHVYSPAVRAEWADVQHAEYKSDLMQPCVDITLPIDVLMAKMQLVLTSMNFQWFHPDEFCLIARHTDEGMYLVVKVVHDGAQSLEMDLYFTQVTQSAVRIILDNVRMALTSD